MPEGVTAGITLLANRYEIGDVIGRGGMATVHVGQDTRLGRRVAVKLLKPSLANDPAFRTRFRQEAQAAARMAHPTIVRVYDAGEETVTETSGAEVQVPYIVMEFVEGRPLSDVIGDGPVESDEAVRITSGILTALEYSHRAGVVHRDIKPANVMVTQTGQVKVMDFGIARAITDTSATVAQTTSILGTASYFSPEQARGETVDARTDLYSTGIVLFELLTGRPPFLGDSPVAVAYQHVSEQPVATLDDHAVGVAGDRRGHAARPGQGPHPSLPERGRVPTRPRTGRSRTGPGLHPEAAAAARERRLDDALRREPPDDLQPGSRLPRARRHPGAPPPAHAEPPPGRVDLGRHPADDRRDRGCGLLGREPAARTGPGVVLGQRAERRGSRLVLRREGVRPEGPDAGPRRRELRRRRQGHGDPHRTRVRHERRPQTERPRGRLAGAGAGERARRGQPGPGRRPERAQGRRLRGRGDQHRLLAVRPRGHGPQHRSRPPTPR